VLQFHSAYTRAASGPEIFADNLKESTASMSDQADSMYRLSALNDMLLLACLFGLLFDPDDGSCTRLYGVTCRKIIFFMGVAVRRQISGESYVAIIQSFSVSRQG
jgi:hypothetical protein